MKCKLCGENKSLSEFDTMENEQDGPVCYDCSDTANFTRAAKFGMVGFILFITLVGVAGKFVFGV